MKDDQAKDGRSSGEARRHERTEDQYTPAAPAEAPVTYNYRDWASI